MPIPALTPAGLLPPGVHRCTLEELRRRFGTFAGSDQRVQVFAKLESLTNQLRQSGWFVALIVDGSFVTRKLSPNDIDLILLQRRSHDWSLDLSPTDYNLVSRAALRRRFGFDVLLAAEGDPNHDAYVEFFGRVREDSSSRKGMLQIEL